MAEDKLTILKRANKFFRQGKVDSAIGEYEKILDIKPNDIEIRRILGDLLRNQNNISGAMKQYEWIADYYVKEGFFTKAIAMYKMITRIAPSSESTLYKLAELYSKQGLVIEAKQIYLDIAEECKRNNNQKKALDMYKRILEFDRSNTKMRLILADNYLKEGLRDEAINEYLITADIFLNKKELSKLEEILLDINRKVKDSRIIGRLIHCYTLQGQEDKALELLRSLGSSIENDVNLLKLLGELYFKKGLIPEAEGVFKKVVEKDPSATEIIMKLGKVFLHRGEFDKTYELFLPVINQDLEEKKYDEASSFLRFIIASNNSYFPALMKLADIFKISNKKNNLIALYESLIPIYEQRGMIEELKNVLQDLIELSDSPFSYKEQLAKLEGQKFEKEKEEKEKAKEREFIEFNLKIVEEALSENDFNKAIAILQKTKKAFSQNLEIRLKLFDIYQLANDVEATVSEGKELLDLYKFLEYNDEYSLLLDKLATLKPSDEKIIELSGNEVTNIDIDFDHEDVAEQLHEIEGSSHPEIEIERSGGEEDDILVLSEENVTEPVYQTDKITKSLSSFLSEIDFYINDGYFGDAAKMLNELKIRYPESTELIQRFERLQKARQHKSGKAEEPVILDEIAAEEPVVLKEEKKAKSEPELVIEPEGFDVEFPSFPADDLNLNLEIESSVVEESQVLQEEENSKSDIDIDLDRLVKAKPTRVSEKSKKAHKEEEDELKIEMEREQPAREMEPIELEIEKEEVPRIEKKKRETTDKFMSSSSEIINFDNIIKEESSPDLKSPFAEIDHMDVPYDSAEEILKDEVVLFEDEEYHQLDDNITEEQEAIEYWLQEVERQRTSTTEKNMMEIFDQFKKGIEEKIGQEDYDTRYNLGIAYKEMGLLEEAIHEFLIASKHESKFFDSAGLLGMCFRDKGMYDEAITWFEKALEVSEKENEEYLAIQYEMMITYNLKEDYVKAEQLMKEILNKHPNYRDVLSMYDDLKLRLGNSPT